MTLNDKIQKLTTTIATEATALGLVFVNGPDTAARPASLSLQENLDTTNGQIRQVYAFSVAEHGTN
jgi:hypothetical protein